MQIATYLKVVVIKNIQTVKKIIFFHKCYNLIPPRSGNLSPNKVKGFENQVRVRDTGEKNQTFIQIKIIVKFDPIPIYCHLYKHLLIQIK